MTKKSSPKRKTLLLLDGNAIIHRAYHAIPPLTTKDGQMVNAVYGFASTLLSVLQKFKPDYIIASFDLPGPTFRHKIAKDYKANRAKAADDLYAQIPLVKDLVTAAGIAIFEKEGFEADDVIGTLARKAEASDIEVIIATGDNDALQLVSEHVRVFTMRRGITDTVIYDVAGVQEKYGFDPIQLIDYKGLRGDSSDNIPGVKGVGEKTATDLLQAYGTLEAVYQHLDAIKPAVRAKLERDKMQAIQSKKLGTIVTDVPLGRVTFEKCCSADIDYDALRTHFDTLNFYSLIKRLAGKGEGADAATSTKEGVKDFKYTIATEATASLELAKLRQHDAVSLAFDTDAQGKLQSLAIAYKTGRAVCVPYTPQTHDGIAMLLADQNVAKTFFDSKAALHLCAAHDFTLAAIATDVSLQAYVLDPDRKTIFEDLVLEVFGEDIRPQEKTQQLSMDLASADEKGQALCQQADYVHKLAAHFATEIAAVAKTQKKGATIAAVLADLELPLVPILAAVEEAGILLNATIFEGIATTLGQKLTRLEKAIHDAAGTDFNINSTQQLAVVLFDTLAIPTTNIKKTKTGYSTASSELEKIKDLHPIVAKVEEYRELFKLKTTYLDPLPTYADDQGRIHTHFNQTVAATGRLSSSDPNLQNIPIRTDLGKLLRTAFVAADGYTLVSADYSQIDLRCVAHVAKDKKMIAAFRAGEDIHQATAAAINDVTPSKVTKAMRSAAKELNFGLIYGMGAFSFARAAGIEQKEAQRFIDAYMQKFSGVAQYMEAMRTLAAKQGFVETPFGRRRMVPGVHSANAQVVAAAERVAINMPIQGLTADIMKLAMIVVDQRIQEQYAPEDVRMILQVHDEIIFEVTEKVAEKFAAEIKEVMEGVYTLSVPLVVDTTIGDNWGIL